MTSVREWGRLSLKLQDLEESSWSHGNRHSSIPYELHHLLQFQGRGELVVEFFDSRLMVISKLCFVCDSFIIKYAQQARLMGQYRKQVCA